jgi:hypothetical protein
LLLDRGAAVEMRNLIHATIAGDETLVRPFLDNNPANILPKALKRTAPISHKMPHAIRRPKGYKSSHYRRGAGSPLTLAVDGGHEAIMRLLHSHGSDVNAKNKAGNTVLMEAAAERDEARVRLLLAHGAVVSENEKGETALDMVSDKLPAIVLLESAPN